jgi:adenylate kinase
MTDERAPQHFVFLLGAAGSGKGTQSARLTRLLGPRVAHVSTGDLIRAEIASQSLLGSALSAILDAGRGVTTPQLLSLISRACAGAARGAELILLDGFPRTLEQARAFEARFGPPARVLSLDADEATLRGRLHARARADDTDAFILKRFSFFREQSEPVADAYDARGLLARVDAAQSVDRVGADVDAALAHVLHTRPHDGTQVVESIL